MTLIRDQQNVLWNNLIDGLNVETDSRTFWQTVKRLKGGQPAKTIKLIRDDTEISDVERIEEEFRLFWASIFKISPEENDDFDLDFEDGIINDLNDQIRYTEPILTIAYHKRGKLKDSAVELLPRSSQKT